MSTPPPPQGRPGGGGSPLAALKKKPALLAVGGAGLVVVIALVKKSSGGGAAANSTATTPTSSGAPTYDSTSSDLYNSIEDQLTQFEEQIAKLQGSMPNGTGSKPPAPKPKPKPKPPTKVHGKPIPAGPPKPIKKPLFSWLTIRSGQTLSGVAAAHHESLRTLLADNPIYKGSKYKGGNLIHPGDKVRVR